MLAKISVLLLGASTLTAALPAGIEVRTVAALNQAAFQEAQQRDATATRAFSSVAIKTSSGQCLFVNKLSGDFRANLNPIQVANCDGSAGQQWDIITAGKHNNIPGTMLIVNTLTQACANFDPRRAVGNQVIMFSCGGRADGGGGVTNSQTFPFAGGAGPLVISPSNQAGSCFTVKGAVIDIATCNKADPNQSFTFGTGGKAAAKVASKAPAKAVKAAAEVTSADSTASLSEAGATALACVASAAATSASSSASAASSSISAPAAEAQVVTVTVTILDTGTSTPTDSASSDSASIASAAAQALSASSTTAAASSTASSSRQVPTSITSAPSTASASAAAAILTYNPTTPLPVSRSGGSLNPGAAAEANQRDDTAARAFSNVSIKAPNGACLFIDPTAGDFRQETIPIALKPCDGSPNEKWDFLTSGKHVSGANVTLVVSSLVQGCLNVDDRRAVGDRVILFSCGGRADGSGGVTGSQVFSFTSANATAKSLRLQAGQTCLVANATLGRVDRADCSVDATDASQLFTIVE